MDGLLSSAFPSVIGFLAFPFRQSIDCEHSSGGENTSCTMAHIVLDKQGKFGDHLVIIW